jgi:hypothetical protein
VLFICASLVRVNPGDEGCSLGASAWTWMLREAALLAMPDHTEVADAKTKANGPIN